MQYKLLMGKKLERFLARHIDMNDKIVEKLELLCKNPYNNTLDIQPLKGKMGIID